LISFTAPPSAALAGQAFLGAIYQERAV